MKLKELKKGEYFCIRPHHEEEVKAKQVYIRGKYDRTRKRYVAEYDVWYLIKFMKGMKIDV